MAQSRPAPSEPSRAADEAAIRSVMASVAAHRAGIRRIMLPARNRKDFDDIPEEARQQLTFVWLEQVDDAVKSALEAAGPARGAEPPAPDARASSRGA